MASGSNAEIVMPFLSNLGIISNAGLSLISSVPGLKAKPRIATF